MNDDAERWGREYDDADLAPWWVVALATVVALAVVYGFCWLLFALVAWLWPGR